MQDNDKIVVSKSEKQNLPPIFKTEAFIQAPKEVVRIFSIFSLLAQVLKAMTDPCTIKKFSNPYLKFARIARIVSPRKTGWIIDIVHLITASQLGIFGAFFFINPNQEA